MNRLIADWQWVLKRSWSVRFIAIAALLSGAEAVLPFYSAKIPHHLFAVLTFATVAGAFVARLVAQTKED